jgi:pimeloyl-ACP methyl ester carboxylesterase
MVGPARVRVRVTGSPGSGTPLLLIMGIGGHLDMWEPLSEKLEGRLVVSFDFPGTGESSLAFLPPTMMHNALFVRLLLRRLALPRVDVLGYSWGGLLAQQLAAQHPSVLGKLVLACTGPGVTCVPAGPRVAWRLLTPRRYYSPEYLSLDPPMILLGPKYSPRSTASFLHRARAPGKCNRETVRSDR